MKLPLEGIVILDLTQFLAGPWCTKMLGSLGAEVLKIEQPGAGDGSRSFAPYINGESAYFMMANCNKKSVTINLKDPLGLELLRGLIKQADVLLHAFRPAVMKTLGLDYDAVRNLNPRIIYCWLSGYGEEGPYINNPSYDILVMGMGGPMSVTGEPDRVPVRSQVAFADILAGYNCATGILAALLGREKTGSGEKVSVNLLDSAVGVLNAPASYYFATGQSPQRVSPSIALRSEPGGTFKTKDSYINISVIQDKEWKSLCKGLQREELTRDPRFPTPAERAAHKIELRQIIEEALSTRTTREWVALLGKIEVPVGPINSIDEVFNDEQVLRNGMVLDIKHPAAGDTRLLRVPLALATMPIESYTPAPRLGEHTEEVLSRYLALSPAEIAELREKGIV